MAGWIRTDPGFASLTGLVLLLVSSVENIGLNLCPAMVPSLILPRECGSAINSFSLSSSNSEETVVACRIPSWVRRGLRKARPLQRVYSRENTIAERPTPLIYLNRKRAINLVRNCARAWHVTSSLRSLVSTCTVESMVIECAAMDDR